MKPRKTLAVPIILLLISISICALLTGYYLNIKTLKAALIEKEFDKFENISLTIGAFIEDEINRLSLLSKILKTNSELKDAVIRYSDVGGDQQPLQKIMNQLYAQMNISIFLVTDSEGLALYNANPQGEWEGIGNSWGIDEALTGEDILAASKFQNRWYINSFAPIYADGKISGVVIVGIQIDNRFIKGIANKANTEISIVALEGEIASTLPFWQKTSFDVKSIWDSLMEEKRPRYVEDASLGQAFMFKTLKIIDERLCLIIQNDITATYNLLNQKKRLLIYASLIVLGLVIILGSLLTSFLIAPLKKLKLEALAMANKYSGGSQTKMIQGNEIQTLVHVFDLMTTSVDQHISEREHAEEALRQARDELEIRVEERTAALSESNTRLSLEITDRKRVQEALTESEKRYRTISELTSDLAYAFRVESGRTLVLEWVTAALKRITGFPLDELIARGGWKSIIYHDDLGRAKDQLRAALEGQSRIAEYRIVTAEGQLRWLRDYGRPVWDATQSRVTHIYGALQDITEQRRAEVAQKESEKKYRVLVENANEGIIVAQDGYLKFTNPRLAELSGYSEEELMANPFLDFVHPEDRKMAVAHHLKKLEHPENTDAYNIRIIDKSGKVRWVENNGIRIIWEARPATLNFLSDITDRIMAEEQLLENKAMLQAVFDGILDPLLLIGRDMATKMLNRAAVAYFGTTDPQEVIGQIYHQVFKGKPEPCEQCEAPERFSSSDFITFERRGLMDPDRYERIVMYPIKENGNHTGDAIVHIRDVTKRRLFERQFVHREKLASLGVLVSSIAHEINNPNNFVSFNIPILREYIRKMIPIMDVYAGERPAFEICNQAYPEFRQDIFKLLDNVEHGSGRISAFVSTLREFSQDHAQKTQRWVDLEEVIERVIAICNNEIQNSVNSFEQSVPDHLPRVYTEPYALEQVLINLLMNAAQAADKKDSWIKLSVSVNAGGPEPLVIEVSDNGCGMAEETRHKIFDPFFSTKSPVDGTGLGLYVCHMLVEGLRGRIEVRSEPTKGSSFRVILPASNGTEAN